MKLENKMTSPQPLKIDIVSDVVCPWCVIGYRQLLQALNDTGTEFEIQWHPFELNPLMGSEGQSLREHVAEKYGTMREQSEKARENITAIGVEVGFQFVFTDNMRMHNTFKTHQLLHWAEAYQKTHELKQALFTAHFTNGRDLSDSTVLAEVAQDIGLEKEEALNVLKDQRFAEEVRRRELFWQQQDIDGVPSIIFKGKHLMVGAQGVENYAQFLKQLADKEN
ncbi:DSBA oxidoreductase [Candidatus Terasakiella magnetica]|uniref:DSBA oxidoreductase n=1 Tax=Candidatus Terasakiella magnetica TaxID=1867952 RepID=A0A1C3RFK9_9PROT|nr:DsbA family oxidoreductase [Candidatus Terasakiella magnetica]SCA56049.1 DSBA oxidoreductase [Candidatus Terasakiella magnetica]